MVSRWVKRFGEANAEALLVSNNSYPGLTVRTNTLKVSREELRLKLEGEGIRSEYTRHSPDGLILSERPELENSESFTGGFFVVQDEASQLISYMLDPKANEKILDLCSGSGIKSSHLAQISKQGSGIISVDNSPRRVETAKKNMEKLGVTDVTIINEDARKARGLEADKVLLDAPCSGLGAIRRKPDIKWNHNQKMIEKYYPAMQRELLDSAAKALKPGGALVYSTCTFEPEENEEVIHGFLKKFKNFCAEKPDAVTLFEGFIDESGYFLKTFPYKHNMDGFFAAKIKRLS
jgi:16S rRNA (cytosine967-C5)-methyltransferase